MNSEPPIHGVTSLEGWNRLQAHMGSYLLEIKEAATCNKLLQVNPLRDKGWKGKVCEYIACLPFGDNKSLPDYIDGVDMKGSHYKEITYQGSSNLLSKIFYPSELLAITGIDEKKVLDSSFEESQLYQKGMKLHHIRYSGAVSDPFLMDQMLLDISTSESKVLEWMQRDYARIQTSIESKNLSSSIVSAKRMGQYLITPKTKSDKNKAGQVVKHRAFYYTKQFLLLLTDEITVNEMEQAFNDPHSNRVDLFLRRIISNRPIIIT